MCVCACNCVCTRVFGLAFHVAKSSSLFGARLDFYHPPCISIQSISPAGKSDVLTTATGDVVLSDPVTESGSYTVCVTTTDVNGDTGFQPQTNDVVVFAVDKYGPPLGFWPEPFSPV